MFELGTGSVDEVLETGNESRETINAPRVERLRVLLQLGLRKNTS